MQEEVETMQINTTTIATAIKSHCIGSRPKTAYSTSCSKINETEFLPSYREFYNRVAQYFAAMLKTLSSSELEKIRFNLEAYYYFLYFERNVNNEEYLNYAASPYIPRLPYLDNTKDPKFQNDVTGIANNRADLRKFLLAPLGPTALAADLGLI